MASRRAALSTRAWATILEAGQATDQAGPVTALSAGGLHTCALTPARAADCWGDNGDGQASDQAGPFGPYLPRTRPELEVPRLRRVWLPQIERPVAAAPPS